VFPIHARRIADDARYMTLDEALERKVVSITELDGTPVRTLTEEEGTQENAGADVNTLKIENRADQPLYLLAGEVVVGGQQDRCVARDTIIPPHSKPTAIEVYCVEHGRWSGGKEFASSKSIAHPKLRQTAQAEKDQGQVWEEVAQMNVSLGTESGTGTYGRAVTDEKVAQGIDPYLAAISPQVGKDGKAVGVAVAVNGEVQCADVFSNPALFQKLWPKLSRSYALDALEKADAKGAKRTATIRDVEAFFKEAKGGKSTVDNKSQVATTLRLESENVVGFETTEEAAPAAGAAGQAAPDMMMQKSAVHSFMSRK
jgi:hypothetical protein